MKEDVRIEPQNKTLKRLSILLVFVVGIVLGSALMYIWQQKQEANKREYAEFEYGVVSGTLRGTGIEWKEYPQFRTVQFTLHGELIVELPQGAAIMPDGLMDENTCKEVSRKTKSVTDGTTTLEYDEVTYLFEKAQIKSNLKNACGVEEDAVCGYELTCVTETENIVVGYIVPMCDEFHVCTKEETVSWVYPQNLEFGYIKLSRTYLDKDVTKTALRFPGITVERKGDTYDLTIKNEGEEAWEYSRMAPSVEVWNQGVWMELETLLGDPLVGSVLEPGETEELRLTETGIWSMPYFVPGLYRMVIFGDKDTYVATEPFVVE